MADVRQVAGLLARQSVQVVQSAAELAQDVGAQARSNTRAAAAIARYGLDRSLSRAGLASQDEVVTLTARIRALEAHVRELSRPQDSAS